MALLNIVKVRLYSHNSCTKEVLSFLQEKESFEVITKKEHTGGTQGEYMKADLEFAIRFLSSYAQKTGGMRGLFLGDKIEVNKKDAKKMVASCDWKGIVEAVKKLEVERNDLTSSLSDIAAEIKILDVWKDIEVIKGEKFAASFFRIHEKDSEQFEAQVKDITELLDISVAFLDGNEVYYTVIASPADTLLVQALAQKCKGEEVILPQGKVSERVLVLKKEKKAKEAKLAENNEAIISYVGNLDGLKASYDCCESSQGVQEAMQSPQKFSALSVLEGWMVEEDIAALQSEMEEKWSGIEIEEIDVNEGEYAPVALKNSAGTRPFSVVTKIYGAPGAKEIDPTPFLAPFFVVFFGLCLTDAGYGALLAGTMGWILWAKMPITSGMKDMVTLLLYAGLSTVFFGILFGGWFGILATASFIPDLLTYTDAENNVKFLGQIFQPMEDLMLKIAPLVILLGIFHLLLGVGIKGYISFKNSDKWGVFMIALPTLCTIGFGVATLLSSISPESDYAAFGILPASVFEICKAIAIASFVVMSVGIIKAGGVIAWFMDVTGWLSNTLSYARLFALGLATGIVASVFNMVAFTIGEMMPTGLDIVVIIAIILFGHTLNVALNLLGAFVHSGRLQFVEFFGQFLEGGGRYFAPMKKSTRYIHTA